MGVKIEHGGGKTGSAPGQIIASGLQAAMQRQQQDKALTAQMLQQIASRQPARGGVGGGSGGGGGGRQPAVDPGEMAAWEAKQAERANEIKFSQEMDLKQEEARLDTNKWKFQFSAKQKQEISRNNQADQAILSALQRGEITPEVAQTMRLKVKMHTAGMEMSMVPDDSQQFPKGQGFGENWLDPKTGGLFRRGDKGQSELLLKPSETTEGIMAAAEIKMKETQQDRKWAAEDAADEQHFKRRLEFDKYLREAYDSDESVAMQAASDAWDEKNPSPEKQRQAAELAAIQQQQAAEQQQQRQAKLQQYVQQQQSLPWFQREEYAGANLTELDAQLPEQVGLAQARLRKIEQGDVNPNDLPDDMKRQRSADVKLVQQYERSYRNQQRRENR